MQSFFATSGLINAIIAIFFGIFVIVKNSRKTVNRLCFLLIFATAIWSFSYWRWLLISDNQSLALFWARMLSVGSTFIPLFYFHWIVTLLGFNKKRFLVFFYILTFFYSIFFFSNYFISSVSPKAGFSFWPNPGLVYNFYLLTHYAGLIIYAIYLLITNYKKTVAIKKQQIKYVLLGSIIGLGGGATNFLLWYNINIIPLGNLLVSFYVIFFTYAIVRYRLMDIRVIVVRTILYFLLILYVAGLFVFLSFVAAATLGEKAGINQAYITLIIAFIIVIGLDPIKKYLAKATDKIFFKNRIDYQSILRRLSEVIAREIELKELLDSILNIITRELKVKNARILLVDERTRTFQTNGFVPGSKKLKLYYKSSLVRYLTENQSIVITEELARIIDDAKTSKEKAYLEKVKAELGLLDAALCSPVIIEEQLTAILAVNYKLSGDMFSGDDIRLFEVLTPQLAAALEKSKLYEEVQDFTKTLQQKVDQATKELSQANVHLQQLDKAKSEFLSIAAHQLRTPITGIKGYLSMLGDGDFGPLSPEQSKIIKSVFEGSERLNRLVNVFLNISRIESGRLKLELKLMILDNIVKEIVNNFQLEAQKKNLTLEFIASKTKTKPVNIDQDKIIDVINNLIDNAIKYTEKGKITVAVKQEKNQVIFSIADTGIGIAPEELADMFNKFSRTSVSEKLNTSGSGLGLYIAKRLIEAHNGKIWAQSQGREKGSMFAFALPVK